MLVHGKRRRRWTIRMMRCASTPPINVRFAAPSECETYSGKALMQLRCLPNVFWQRQCYEPGAKCMLDQRRHQTPPTRRQSAESSSGFRAVAPIHVILRSRALEARVSSQTGIVALANDPGGRETCSWTQQIGMMPVPDHGILVPIGRGLSTIARRSADGIAFTCMAGRDNQKGWTCGKATRSIDDGDALHGQRGTRIVVAERAWRGFLGRVGS